MADDKSLMNFRILLVVAIGLALTAALAIGLTIWWLRSEAVENASQDASNLARVLADQTNRSVQSIDALIANVQGRIEAKGTTTPEAFRDLLKSEDTYRLLTDLKNHLTEVASITIIDENGLIINSTSQWPMPPMNLSDREHFKYLKSHDTKNIYISQLTLERISGSETLFFARRVNGANNEFLGVISIGVRLSYFQHIYKSINSLVDMSFLFLRKDGTVIVRYPGVESRAGEKLPTESPWHSLVSGDGGIYRSPGYFDGDARLVAVRPLRDYPLVVNVAVSEAAALSAWRIQAISISLGTLLIIFCLAFLLKSLSRQFRQLSVSQTALAKKAEELERVNAKADAALNNMSQGLAMFDSSARLIVCNDQYLRMYKLPPELVMPGCSILDLLKYRAENGTFFGNPEELRRDLLMDAAKGNASSLVMEIGDGRTISVVNTPMADAGWVATHEDVTEKVQAEKTNELQKLQLDAALDNMSQGICLFDEMQRLSVCNSRYAELYGLTNEQTKPGTPLRSILSNRIARGSAPIDSAKYINDRIKEVEENRPYEVKNRLSDGRYISVVHRPLPGGGWVATHEDVTEETHREQRVRRMAHYDTLTDLPNRAYFNETMEATLNRAAIDGKPFTVLSADLDHFKEANDTHGHLVGDALLREVAVRLQVAAEGEFVARVGGDEFVLILKDNESAVGAMAVADRLLAAFVPIFEIEGQSLKLGLSIGIATYPTDGADAKSLLNNADAALYRAKAETRGVALIYEPEMGARVRERHALQDELRRAIDLGQIFLNYQPQLKTSGETIGFEALARWQCPNRGIVPPAAFIPVAEESGLIIPMGEWVLREACREAASWPKPLTIAVNISPVQFRHGDLPRLVHSILLETGLTPARLELEITESVMIDDFSRAVSILNRLKSLGVKIAMDDFGTGYSSLSYLQAFRCDKIKIDRVFICDLESNNHSRAIVRAVIGLGRSLDLPILAEGVETEAQLAFLVQEGCDEIQGYLKGRPLPIAAYAERLGREVSVRERHKAGK